MQLEIIENNGTTYLEIEYRQGGSIDPIPVTDPHPAEPDDLITVLGWNDWTFPDGTETWLSGGATDWLNMIATMGPNSVFVRARVRTYLETVDSTEFLMMDKRYTRRVAVTGPDYVSSSITWLHNHDLYPEVPENWDGSLIEVDG